MREWGIGGTIKLGSHAPPRVSDREMLERIEAMLRELRALLLAQSKSS